MWSALKLANFSGRNELLEKVVAKELTRIKIDNGIEKWGDDFHRSKVGDLKDAKCWSCFVVSTSQALHSRCYIRDVNYDVANQRNAVEVH